jgi:LruC domain-containing protein
LEKNMGRYAGILLLGAALLVGCSVHMLEPVPPVSSSGDVISDILRDQEFHFENYLPVLVSITPDTSQETSRGLTEAGPVIVRIADETGNALLTAASWEGETVVGEVLLPAATVSLTLLLEGPGWEPREIIVENPVIYQAIDRVLVMTKDPDPDPDTADADGDGVPDVYDAFPDDPEIAFTQAIPADRELTVAFEDNYPNLGDGDYNDFIARYVMTEYLSSRNELVKIDGDVVALARGAAFDHEFGFVIRFPGESGIVHVSIYDPDGVEVETREEAVADMARIVIFGHTTAAFRRQMPYVRMDNALLGVPPSEGYTAHFDLRFDGKFSKPEVIDRWAPFDPYLYVHNTGCDVHLIGCEPLPGSQNPEGLDGTVDANGYPRALLVPEQWLWPLDRAHIEMVYPAFAIWRESEGTMASNWYLTTPTGDFYPRVQ